MASRSAILTYDYKDREHHEEIMDAALEEARIAFSEGEVPVGAVAVEEGRIVAREHNRVEQLNDCTAHAEMLVLKKLFSEKKDWRLENILLYVSLEPCVMCAGAIQLARLRSLVFGAYNERKGAVRTLFRALDEPGLNHRVEIVEGIKKMECETLMKKFFLERRNEDL